MFKEFFWAKPRKWGYGRFRGRRNIFYLTLMTQKPYFSILARFFLVNFKSIFWRLMALYLKKKFLLDVFILKRSQTDLTLAIELQQSLHFELEPQHRIRQEPSLIELA
jgi:hypothetical protein